jgi:copper chaperone CopZ
MANDAVKDQLAVIRVEGMHSHKCEQTLRKALLEKVGVHEVEVDFNTGQASVLFDPAGAKIAELLESVNEAGYGVVGVTQAVADAQD